MLLLHNTSTKERSINPAKISINVVRLRTASHVTHRLQVRCKMMHVCWPISDRAVDIRIDDDGRTQRYRVVVSRSWRGKRES
jgi:hypothetical protein